MNPTIEFPRNEGFGKLLDEIADHCLDKDNPCEGDYSYSDEDCMNVLVIYNHITGNRAVAKMQVDSVGMDFGCEIAARIGDDLHKHFKMTTGIDSKTFFKP